MKDEAPRINHTGYHKDVYRYSGIAIEYNYRVGPSRDYLFQRERDNVRLGSCVGLQTGMETSSFLSFVLRNSPSIFVVCSIDYFSS